MKQFGWIAEAVGGRISGASASRLQIRMAEQLQRLKPLTIDFIEGETQRRAKSIAASGGKSGLLQAVRSIERAAAVGEKPPLLLDATAGLGRDAVQLALAGYRVVMVERCLPVALLLAEAIIAARVPSATACNFGGGWIGRLSAAAQSNLACAYHPLGAEELLKHIRRGVYVAQQCSERIAVVHDADSFWRHIAGDGPPDLARRPGQAAGMAADAQPYATPLQLRPHIAGFAVPFHAKGEANRADTSAGCCWWRALGLSQVDRLAAVTIDPMWDAVADAPSEAGQGEGAQPRSTLRRKGTQQRELQYLEALAAPTSQMEIRQLIEAAVQAVAVNRQESAEPATARTGLASVVVKQHVRAPPLWATPKTAAGTATASKLSTTTAIPSARLLRTVPGTVARFDLYG